MLINPPGLLLHGAQVIKCCSLLVRAIVTQGCIDGGKLGRICHDTMQETHTKKTPRSIPTYLKNKSAAWSTKVGPTCCLFVWLPMTQVKPQHQDGYTSSNIWSKQNGAIACTNWILDCYNPDGCCVVFVLLWFVAVSSYYTMGVKEQPILTICNSPQFLYSVCNYICYNTA